MSRHLFCHCSVCMVVGTWKMMVSFLYIVFADAAVCRIDAFAQGMPEYAGQ